MKSIAEWQKEVHENAKNHGWYDSYRPIPELLCLIHSEVSEALESYRASQHADVSNDFIEECADIAIRLFDMCEYLGIDLEDAIRKKHEKNISRSYRHGGKRC